MLNSIRKTKFHVERFSGFTSFSSSAPKIFLLQLNQFTSSAANASKLNSENPNQDSFPATYLQNSCGFSPESALLHSNHLKFDSPEKPDSVIAFFKNHNFSDTQISIIVKKWPLVFNYVPESSFRPKIEFFRNLGFHSPDIVKILTMAPFLLERSLENQIIPIVDFLGSFLGSNKDVVLSVMRYPFILEANLHDTLLHNVGMLRFAGVPAYHIVTLLKNSPGKIAVKPENFRAIVEELQRLGLKPHRRSFILGIMVMRQLSSSTWKEKIDYYKKWVCLSIKCWMLSGSIRASWQHPRIRLVEPSIFWMVEWDVLQSKGLVEQGSLLECLQRLSIESFVVSYAEKDLELLKLYIRKFLASRKSRGLVEGRVGWSEHQVEVVD